MDAKLETPIYITLRKMNGLLKFCILMLSIMKCKTLMTQI